MPRNHFYTAACALSLAIAGCASVSEMTGTLAPTGWTESGSDGPKLTTSDPTVYAESEDGARLSDQIENQGDLQQLVLNMPESEALLNQMLERVAQHWPHATPQPAKVKLSMLSEYAGATYADGTILIGLGTFTPIAPGTIAEDAAQAPTVSSDEELLYLLAHEYSHYALGHHNKTDTFAGLRSLTADLTNMYNTAAVLQEVRYQKTSDGGQIVVTNQNKVASDMEKAISTFDLVGAISARGLSPAWNRSQEDEADVLALDLIKAEGINAPVYEGMFNALAEHEKLSSQLANSLKLSVSEAQKQALNPAILQQALDGNASTAGSSIFDNAKNTFMRSARQSLFDYIGQTHRPPEVRLRGVQNYELAAYPDITADSRDMAAFMEEPSTAVIDQLTALTEFDEARLATVAYYKSIEQRTEGNYAAAELAIQQAMTTRFSTQPSIQFEAGRVAEFAGNTELAKTRYRAALEVVPLPDAYRKLARLEIRTGQYGVAEAVIAEGESRLGDIDYFLPSRINLAVAREDVDGAIGLVTACRATDRAELIAACEASHAGMDPSELTPEQQAFFEKKGQVGSNAGEGIIKGLGGLFDRD